MPNVFDSLSPLDPRDTYPITDPKYGIGSYREVEDLNERDSISSQRRRSGMLVYVIDVAKIYKLENDLLTWTEFKSSETYTNASPSLISVGGVESGTVFSDMSTKQIFDMMFYPYQYPSFSSFSITSVGSLYEVGDGIAAGTYSFLWSLQNSGNVLSNSIKIRDLGNASLLGESLSNDGNESIPLPQIKKSSASSHSFSIEATNSKNGILSRSLQISWQWRRYSGVSSSSTLLENEIKALSSSLASGKNASYSFPAGGYKFFAWPDSFGSPTTATGFKDSVTGLAIAMADGSEGYDQVANGWNYKLVSLTNSFGILTPYRLYRTSNVLGSDITIIVS